MMDIIRLHNQGLSQREISRRLGISRPTVRKYLEDPSQVGQYRRKRSRPSQLDPYGDVISSWIKEDPHYKATWIYDRLRGMGFTGSYEIVKGRVRKVKAEAQRVAYIRFETEPGRQAQIDFGEFQVVQTDETIKKYYLFAMILGYSRKLYGEFMDRCDLPAFLDGHIHAFTHFGGVPTEILYDRMKNVFIRKLAGKTIWNSHLVSLAVHYGFSPLVAPPYAPWVKGKVERPFDFIREGFWRGYAFRDVSTANLELGSWLAAKENRIHGTTRERISSRFQREEPLLGNLPPVSFDTSLRLYRKVHKDCTIMVQGNSYVVPHTLVGTQVMVRLKDNFLRVFKDEECVVQYNVPEARGQLVQDPRFYAALREDRALNQRKYGRTRLSKGKAKRTISPTLGVFSERSFGRENVEVRPLSVYTTYAEE
ncbi:MAG: IS21 family transposase [Candidatus Binatia bacterium]